MDWITQEQAKQAAEQGELPSLECSLEHHQQGRDATKLELIMAIENGNCSMGGQLCACCSKYRLISSAGSCKDCPLEEATEIHQKLGQLIAYAKRKQENKKC
ncbi:hypothetical protein LCGC14_0376080 [marine sediment metagenome]|uniref:Uncharacterized protein n=1 Tax=marine sediment metagenome TaxID=412755 RepID=A0A0F9T3T5_9ZZZZ